MDESEPGNATVSLPAPTDVPAVLSRVGVDYVGVHDQRVLAIYHTAIFNVTTDLRSLSNAETLEIECWETPISSHTDERSSQAILDDFVDLLDSAHG